MAAVAPSRRATTHIFSSDGPGGRRPRTSSSLDEANQSSTLSTQPPRQERRHERLLDQRLDVGLAGREPPRVKRSDLMLSRVAASPSSRERRATAASARASQPGTRCASAASISSSAHSGTRARKTRHVALAEPRARLGDGDDAEAFGRLEPRAVGQVHDTVVERARERRREDSSL